MKFAYIDESGAADQGDVFTMAGVLIDATKLRKWTIHFDQKITAMLARNPKYQAEIKTKRFIEGRDQWDANVTPQERMIFLHEICDDVTKCAEVYAYGMSLKGFDHARTLFNDLPQRQAHHWVASAMLIACLIQKHQTNKSANKGNTVLIFDHNSAGMPGLSENIFRRNDWYDSLYSKGKLKPKDRFNQIINSGFSIRSEYSSLIQVADMMSYIYRRYLELEGGSTPHYASELNNYKTLISILDRKRQRLGRCPAAPAVEFYKQAKHAKWKA